MSEHNNIDIEENLGLVHACAKRFKGRGIEYDDLYQAGCMGLVKAADNFNTELGYKFSTYAVPVIIGEIKRLFRDGGSVKISRGLKELSLKLTRESEKFISETGREPTVSELAEKLGISKELAAEGISAAMPPVSLTITNDDGEIQSDIPTDSPDESITEIISLETAETLNQYCRMKRIGFIYASLFGLSSFFFSDFKVNSIFLLSFISIFLVSFLLPLPSVSYSD